MRPGRNTVGRLASLVAVGYLLWTAIVAPFALASSERELPACCRKNGRHHCVDLLHGGVAPGSKSQPSLSSVCNTPLVHPLAAWQEAVILVAGDSVRRHIPLTYPTEQGRTQSLCRLLLNHKLSNRAPPTLS